MTRIGPIAADRPSEKSDSPSESKNAGFQTACVFHLTGKFNDGGDDRARFPSRLRVSLLSA
jgi:hypothetical protein